MLAGSPLQVVAIGCKTAVVCPYSSEIPASCGCRLEIGDVGKLQAIAEAVAIVSRRIANATGDGNPGWNGHAEQTNKRQKPPHESSPFRTSYPRNGFRKRIKSNGSQPPSPMLTARPTAGRRGARMSPAASTRRQAAACGRRDETHEKCPKKKVYQDGPTSGMERDATGLCPIDWRGWGLEAEAQLLAASFQLLDSAAGFERFGNKSNKGGDALTRVVSKKFAHSLNPEMQVLRLRLARSPIVIPQGLNRLRKKSSKLRNACFGG